jgi:hypothetical protein
MHREQLSSGQVSVNNVLVSGIPQRQDGDRWKAVDADRIEQYHYGTIATTSIQYLTVVYKQRPHRLLVKLAFSSSLQNVRSQNGLEIALIAIREGDSALNGL